MRLEPGRAAGRAALTRLANPGRDDRPLAGIACMVGGMVLLVLSDASAKWLTGAYPATEVVSLRALFIVALVAMFSLRGRRIRMVNRRGLALRALFAVFSSYLFVYSLSFLPLAEATAAGFAGPIFLAALAGPMIGEKVGPRRWAAVLIGFFGVVIMLGPSGAQVNWLLLLPVAAACLGALRDLVTRRISVTDNAATILFTTNVATTLFGVFFCASWTLPSVAHLLVLIVSAALIGLAHYLHIEAFRLAEAATVAPFRYTGIVWAVLFGLAFFGQLPGFWVMAGGTLVVASGLYIMHRERVRQRAQEVEDGA